MQPCFTANGMRKGRCLEGCKYEKEPKHIPHECAHGHQWTVFDIS